jgi:hypothetical protein
MAVSRQKRVDIQNADADDCSKQMSIDCANARPPEAQALPLNAQDFGTSRWPLFNNATPLSGARGRARDVRCWHLASVFECRLFGRYRGKNGHAADAPESTGLTLTGNVRLRQFREV